MRVIHFSPSDTDGGAAKGAYKLHGALRHAGVDSLMLVQRKYSGDPSVLPISENYGAIRDGLRDRLDRLPLKMLRRQPPNWWTLGWLPFDVSPVLARLAPDVVQFHWAGRGAAPIEMFRGLRDYPVVWTLRDMWPLTGGCHYSDGCEKFLEQCGDCPQLDNRLPIDLARWQWRRKYRAWRDAPITFVALSRWMADYARRSPLTFGNEVALIPNGVDIDRFAPMDKAVARSIWKLPQNKRIIMFGAINAVSDKRKGYRYLRDALRQLADQGWAKDAIVVVFGSRGEDLETGFETRSVGWLSDDVSLALMYSCADVMVVPSLQENLGKTGIEALACGVPVVAFGNTGMPDIVDHRKNGYLAENLSSSDLARGIAWCLEQSAESDSLAVGAREKVMRCFDIREIASRHVALYQRLLMRAGQGSAAAASATGSQHVVKEGSASGPVGIQ